MNKQDAWRLDRRAANYCPLSPISFLTRTAQIYPDYPALVYHSERRTYREFLAGCERASAVLDALGAGRGDVVSVMLPNIPAMVELHFAGISEGRVLHPVNTRLSATEVRFQLEHAGTRVLVFDREYRATIGEALAMMANPPAVLEVIDPFGSYDQKPSSWRSYHAACAEVTAPRALVGPDDEWDAIAVSYTSGTTGSPKGVVTHHRGAYLNATANTVAWSMPHHPSYLWVLPMFHCDGWCFPWTITLLAGTHVCLRKVDVGVIAALIESEQVTHLCAAPVVLAMLASATGKQVQPFSHQVRILTAGAAPPAAVIEAVEKLNVSVTQVYGLTETYSSTVISAWQRAWDDRPKSERSHLKARQGVQYPACEAIEVVDSALRPVPRDGATIGEIVVRGNTVMKGYLGNPDASDAAFAGGWFHTGDLAVRDPDGYIVVKDRTKDMINSGGEKLSSIEIEDVLSAHPAVLEVAVIGAPDDLWGEVPWAFVKLRPQQVLTEDEARAFCGAQLARYKVPKRFVFGDIERTATGKVQKYRLREIAQELAALSNAEAPGA